MSGSGYGGQLVALDVNNQQPSLATPLLQAAQINGLNAGTQGQQLQNQQLQFQLQTQRALLAARQAYLNGGSPAGASPSPLAAAGAQPPAAAPTAAASPLAALPPPQGSVTSSPLAPVDPIAGAAQGATDAKSWDAAFGKLAAAGNTEAGQYVGRYTPQLQTQVQQAYGAPTAAAGASPLAAAQGAPTGPQSSPLAASAPPPGPGIVPAAGGAPAANDPQASALRTWSVYDPQGAAEFMKLQGRINYAQTGDVSQLRIDPQAYQQINAATKDMSDAQKTRLMTQADIGGRISTQALLMPAGPQRDAFVRQSLQQAGMTPTTIDHFGTGQITDQMLQQGQTASMNVKDYMDANGITAGNTARAQLPSELTKIGATGAQARLTQAADVPNKLAVQSGAARYDFVTVRNPDGSTSQVPAASAAAQGAGAVPTGTAPAAVPGAAPPGAGAAPPSTVPGALPGKLDLSPEQTGLSTGYGKINDQITEAGSKVNQTLQRVATLRNAATDAFRPGATGEDRAQLGRNVTDLFQLGGMEAPPWASNLATGSDTIQKVGGQMVSDLVRSLGSREALGVYQQVQKFMPNINMSQGGFNVVLNSVQQGAIKDQDMLNFRDNWLQTHPSIAGMQQSFDKQYPPESYASRVWPMTLPKDQTKLIPNVVYRNPQGVSSIWVGNGFAPVGSQ